jgi:hypothetical protein
MCIAARLRLRVRFWKGSAGRGAFGKRLARASKPDVCLLHAAWALALGRLVLRELERAGEPIPRLG